MADELTSLITLYVRDVRKVKEDNGKEVWEPVNISEADLQKLAEEAGHFIIGALGNNRLVQRLIDRIRKPEVRRAVLGSEYESAILGPNELREVAGRLVEDALIGYLKDLKRYGMWRHTDVWDLYSLLKRTKDSVVELFSKFKKTDIAGLKVRAERTARQIVELPSSMFDLDTALEKEETLFNSEGSANIKTFRHILSNLEVTCEKLKAASKKVSDDMLEELVRFAKNKVVDMKIDQINQAGTVFSQMTALKGIAEALLELNKILTEPDTGVLAILDSVKIANDDSFFDNFLEYSEKLNRARIVITAIVELNNELGRVFPSASAGIKDNVAGKLTNPNQKNNGGFVVQIYDITTNAMIDVNIGDEVKKLNELLNGSGLLAGLVQKLDVKELNFAARFLSEIYGADYVRRSARVVWNRKRNRIGAVRKNIFVVVKDAELDDNGKIKLNYKDYTIAELLEKLHDGDISFWHRYIASMSNNSDIISQIADRAMKQANFTADRKTNEMWDKLRLLLEKINLLGLDQKELFEEYDENMSGGERKGLTGNIISDLNWGEWEADFEEFKRIEFENFKKRYSNWNSVSSLQRSIDWGRWFGYKQYKWHKANSEFNKVTHRYEPAAKYSSNKLDDLRRKYGREFDKVYDEIMALKKELDSKLPVGSTLTVRAPQFKAPAGSMIANQHGNYIKRLGVGLRKWIINSYTQNEDDDMFGSDRTYNTPEEALFESDLESTLDNIRRLPVFGVRKLRDMTQLKTDLIGSMLAYASMAYSYEAMSNVSNAFEITKEVMGKRKDPTEPDEKPEGTYVYKRFSKFLDKQLYGISFPKTAWRKIVLEKILDMITRLGSYYYLGGNPKGAVVNTMTGFNEITKEAIAGEFFTVKDLMMAHKMYYSSFVNNWAHYGTEYHNDKVSLFLRHFNALHENKRDYRNWNTAKAYLVWNMFSQSVMLPYTSGDHYMQAMSYLSMAHKTKLYDEHDKSINLFNAYEKVSNTDGQVKNGKKLIDITTPNTVFDDKYNIYRPEYKYYTSETGHNEYVEYYALSKKLEQIVAAGGGVNVAVVLTPEDMKRLGKLDLSKNKKYLTGDLNDLAVAARKARKKAEEYVWDERKESQFADKCREINIRMHRIYNSYDKTGLNEKAYFNMLLSMRNYALGMAERRFAAGHYSTVLGQEVEGSENTFFS